MATTLSYTLSVPAPTGANAAVAKRQSHAVQRTVNAVQELLNQLTPEELEVISGHIESALTDANDATPTPPSELVTALTGGRRYSQEEQLALKLSALLRTFRHRRQVLADALTATQVAELLGTSRQTPHDRVKSATLLAVFDRGAWRFPVWQFDPQGPDGVIPGLPAVLRALRVSPLAKVSWFVRPNPSLDGRTPLEALRAGEGERVVSVAQGVGGG